MEDSSSFCESSSSENVFYDELQTRIPEILLILKNDKALANMMLDMINHKK